MLLLRRAYVVLQRDFSPPYRIIYPITSVGLGAGSVRSEAACATYYSLLACPRGGRETMLFFSVITFQKFLLQLLMYGNYLCMKIAGGDKILVRSDDAPHSPLNEARKNKQWFRLWQDWKQENRSLNDRFLFQCPYISVLIFALFTLIRRDWATLFYFYLVIIYPNDSIV